MKVAGGNREVIIPMAGVEGAEVIIAPNSVTLPDGRTEGMMMFSQVQTDKVPMPAPNGTTFDLAWTLQPAGTDFYPPARIALPNSNGQAPGTELEMFSFDHDLMEWVSIGQGVVSEDGSKIVSKPGHGIRHSGWGGAPPPPPPDDTCNVECNDNNECTDDSKYDCGCNNDLVLPPDRAKSEQEEGNCQEELCSGSRPDDSDINEESDVQYDCKKPGCENGSPKDMPDAGDISEEDKKCNKCENMAVVADAAKNEDQCEDEGNPSCSIDRCENGTCNHTRVTELTPHDPDPLGVDIENLKEVTRVALNCLQNALSQIGGRLVVNSAYRPQTYQDHLRLVYDTTKLIDGYSEAECKAVIASVEIENEIHGDFAYRPARVSNHTLGYSFDANWFDVPQGSTIDDIALKCNLHRPLPVGDRVHFTVRGH